MIINKRKSYFFMLFFLASIIPKFVSAKDVTSQAQNLGQTFFTGIMGFVSGFISPLSVTVGFTSRVFLAILLGMIIYSIITVMFSSSKPWIQWTITGIITSLAFLGLPANFLNVILVSYGAMGATILTIIPFIIVLVFSLRTRSPLFARVTWIFYSMYYLATYLYFVVLNLDLVNGNLWLQFLAPKVIPYLIAFIVGVCIFFFMSSIRNLIFKGELAGIREEGYQGIEIGQLLKELKGKELHKVYGSVKR